MSKKARPGQTPEISRLGMPSSVVIYGVPAKLQNIVQRGIVTSVQRRIVNKVVSVLGINDLRPISEIGVAAHQRVEVDIRKDGGRRKVVCHGHWWGSMWDRVEGVRKGRRRLMLQLGLQLLLRGRHLRAPRRAPCEGSAETCEPALPLLLLVRFLFPMLLLLLLLRFLFYLLLHFDLGFGWIVSPRSHCHAFLEMSSNVGLSNAPALQSNTTESTCPTLIILTLLGVGTFLPSCLRNIEQCGTVEVFNMLA